jgi:hypothetical protein
MPRKTFTAGEVLAAADVNEYLMDQSVMTFADSAARGSAIGTAIAQEGMLTYLEDTDAFEYWDGSAFTAFGGGGGAATNAIINGAFEINQRNFTSSTASGYGFDRWTTLVIGGTVTQSAQSFTPGSAPESGYEAANFARVVTSGQSAAGDLAMFRQIIENVRTFANQTITVSFWAKAGSGTPSVSVDLTQNFGSGGSTAAPTFAGKITLSTSWQRYSLSVSLPTISGKTLGTSSFLALNLFLSAGSDRDALTGSLGIQSNTFDIWGVQLEEGSTATEFKRNANSLQGELAACQRYFEAVESFNVSGTAQSTSIGMFNCYLKVRKRTNPTIAFRSTTYAFDRTGIGSNTGTGQNAQIASIDLCVWNVTGASGLTIGQHLVWNGGNVEFSSEF